MFSFAYILLVHLDLYMPMLGIFCISKLFHQYFFALDMSTMIKILLSVFIYDLLINDLQMRSKTYYFYKNELLFMQGMLRCFVRRYKKSYQTCFFHHAV